MAAALNWIERLLLPIFGIAGGGLLVGLLIGAVWINLPL